MLEVMDEQVELLYASRAPTMQWWDRIDPVNEVEWKDLVSTGWTTMSAHRNDLVLDKRGYLTHQLSSHWSPIARSDRALYNARAILTMAMLHEWNQLSTFQLSTMLGEGRRAVWNTMAELYSAGMVKRLTPDWWDSSVDESGSGSVWRIDRSSWTTMKWFSGLDNLEWALVTNNVDPEQSTIGSNTPTALRHNLATIEIILKAMESCPGIIGAWGEGHAYAASFYEQNRFELDDVRNNVGDAVLVSRAGKIIVLEVSGANRLGQTTAGNKIVEKAAAWVAACGKSELDLNVIFVDVSNRSRTQQFYANVDYGVRQVSEKYASQERIRRRGGKRVFAVDARDWFPIPRAIGKDFQTLKCLSTVTGEYGDLLTEGDNSMAAGSDPVINTLAALHTPWWIHQEIDQ